MKTNKTIGWLLAAVLVALAAPVSAQDAQADSSGGGGGGGSSSGIALEFQGRLALMNTNGTGLLSGFGNTTTGSGAQGPATMPLVTAGVRLLDQRLFVGVGIGFYGMHERDCTGAVCSNQKVRGWNLTPTVSYDVLVRGPARLYPLGMFNLGRAGTTVNDPGGGTTVTTDGDFWWGMNLGLGIRGEIADTMAIGTEWGWGFARTSNSLGTPAGSDSNAFFSHGAFGTIFFSARIGL